MDEEEQARKRRRVVAENVVNHIAGEGSQAVASYSEALTTAVPSGGLYFDKPVETSVFDHLPLQALLKLRKTNKSTRDQIDKYLRIEKYKMWNLPKENLISNISAFVFFDFDPRYSLEIQIENYFEHILLTYEYASYSDVTEADKPYFRSEHLDIQVYLMIPVGTESISDYAFYPSLPVPGNDICKVYIPDTVQEIGKKAFFKCKKLVKVKFPRSLVTIGEEAFAECSSLKSVKINKNIQTIGTACFEETGLESIFFEDSDDVLEIEERAFYRCSNLHFLHLPYRPVIMSDNAFMNTRIEHLIIPSGDHTFGYGCFQGCLSLDIVDISGDIKEISPLLFNNCTGLRHVKLPNTLREIKYGAFEWTVSLSEIEFSASLTYIGEKAFKNSGLRHVTFHPDTRKINYHTDSFLNCPIESVKCSYEFFKNQKEMFKGTSPLTSVVVLFQFYEKDPYEFYEFYPHSDNE